METLSEFMSGWIGHIVYVVAFFGAGAWCGRPLFNWLWEKFPWGKG